MKVDREINIANKYLVTTQGSAVRIMNTQDLICISADEALLLAAWLVAVADGNGEFEFEDVLNAVRNS